MTNTAKANVGYIVIEGSRIPKLTGSLNYISWAAKVKLAFQFLKIWGYVDGTIKAPDPDPPSLPEGIPERPPDDGEEDPHRAARQKYNSDFEAYITHKEEWQKNIPTVLFYLKNSLNDIIATKMEGKEDPKEIWDYLSKTYKDLGMAAVMQTRVRFYQTKWNSQGEIQDFFDLLETIQEPLRHLDESLRLQDIDTLTVITIGLPATYQPTIQTLNAQTDVTKGITNEIVDAWKTYLRDEWHRQKSAGVAPITQAYAATTYNTTQFPDPVDAQPQVWIGKWGGAPCRHCNKSHPTYGCHDKYPFLKAEWLRRKNQQLDTQNRNNNGSYNGTNNNNNFNNNRNGFQSRFNRNGNNGNQFSQRQNQNNSNNNNNGNQQNGSKRTYDMVAMANYSAPGAVSFSLALDHLRCPDGRVPFILDSGTTDHIAFDKREFVNIKLFDTPQTVTVGGLHQLAVLGRGDVHLLLDVEGTPKSTLFTNVLYSPQMGVNLLSTTQLRLRGYNILERNDGKSFVYDDQGLVLLTTTVRFKQNILDYAVLVEEAAPEEAVATHNALISAYQVHKHDTPDVTNVPMSMLLHQRMGHINIRKLQQMGFKINSYGICEPCKLAKGHTQRSTIPQDLCNNLYERIHVDTCGPIETPAIFTNNIYFNLFVDDKSRYQTYTGLPSKDIVFEKTVQLIDTLVNDGYNIAELKSDHGGEYRSIRMNDFMKKHRIKIVLSPVGTPELNGVAERSFRSLLEAVRASLFTCGLPPCFWELCAAYCNYQINRNPRDILDGKSPYEVMTGSAPQTCHMRVFGCNAYATIKTDTTKLEEKARLTVFVGIQSENVYKVYDHDRNMVFTARDVEFDEANFSEAQRVYSDFEDIEPDDPYDKDYDPEAFYTAFPMLEGSSDTPVIKNHDGTYGKWPFFFFPIFFFFLHRENLTRAKGSDLSLEAFIQSNNQEKKGSSANPFIKFGD